MKKIILFILITLISFNTKAQNNDGIVAAAALVGAIGAAVASMEYYKEQIELAAVEKVLDSYPDFVNFELSTLSLRGVKAKNISSVSLLTYDITNLDDNSKYVLFGFTSYGWINDYGVNFKEIIWELFSKDEWNKMMLNYVETASKEKLTLEEISQSKIVNSGVKSRGKFILKFDKIGGDVYYTSDYSNKFKIVFNERSLGLFIKETSELVQIRRSSIISAHLFLNGTKRVGQNMY